MNAAQQGIVREFNAHMGKYSSHYGEWYVGVAAAPRARLFDDHAVKEKSDAWIFHGCATSREAREIEDHFLAQGAKGGPGGGDATTKSVYAYKIAPHTIE